MCFSLACLALVAGSSVRIFKRSTHDHRDRSRPIATEHPLFVIAEMSDNHNQSLERALEIVESAVQAGAHAIKLQTYTADTMTLDVRGGSF